MKHVLTMVALSLMNLGLATSPALSDDTEIDAALRSLLGSFRETYGFPGATVAYALQDGTTGAVAVGLADVEADIPMTPESRMLAASIGKTIWGALVLSLESEGVLDRADLVSGYLGELPWFGRVPNAQDMTIGHLLTHTSGVPDHVHLDGVAGALIDMGQTAPFAPEAAIAFNLDEPPLFEAGTAWSYTDSGYLLLGLVIEAATGRDVFELAQERFLTPLGLFQTIPSDGPVIEGLAVGYTFAPNPFGLPPRTSDDTGALLWNPAVEWTGGGFVSTSSDLARWGHALFTGVAMDELYMDRLLDAVPAHPDAPGIRYGSGVAIYTETPHGPVYGHGGWIPGYVSSLRHYADHGLTIAFQINTDVGMADDSSDLVPSLASALADLLIDAVPAQ